MSNFAAKIAIFSPVNSLWDKFFVSLTFVLIVSRILRCNIYDLTNFDAEIGLDGEQNGKLSFHGKQMIIDNPTVSEEN